MSAEDYVIDLTLPESSVVKVLTGYQGSPDDRGVTSEYDIRWPEFKAGILFRSSGWPRGTARLVTSPFAPGNPVGRED